jgi:hypothetical protein
LFDPKNPLTPVRGFFINLFLPLSNHYFACIVKLSWYAFCIVVHLTIAGKKSILQAFSAKIVLRAQARESGIETVSPSLSRKGFGGVLFLRG